MIDFRRTGGGAVLILLLLLESSTPAVGLISPDAATGFVVQVRGVGVGVSSFSREGDDDGFKLYMSSRFNLRNRFRSAIAPPSNRGGQGQRQRQRQSRQTRPKPTSDVNIDIPRIQVRPRPLVALDESTGQYIRTDKTSESPSSSPSNAPRSSRRNRAASSYNFNSDDYPQLSLSGWSYFKDFVYDTIDTVSGIPSALGLSKKKRGGRNTSSNAGARTGTASGNSNSGYYNRNLAVAYSDTVEFKSKNNRNPLSSITRTFAGQKSVASSSSGRSSTTTSGSGSGREQLLVRQYKSSLSASNKVRSDGEDLFKSDARKSFDAAKDGIYDLFSPKKKTKKDTAPAAAPASGKARSPLLDKIMPTTSSSSSLSSSETTSSTSSPTSLETDSTTFKPPAKPSTNQDETVINLTPYLADLDSPNPIKVLQAKFAIAAEERKRKRRLQEQAQREAIDDIKNRVYGIVDTVQTMYATVASVPDKVEEAVIAAEEAIEKSAEQTRNTVREVQAIPSKVQKAVEDTKKSVDDTKRATIEVVEEVRSIPKKVENKVAETKQSIQETKEGVESVVKKVEDLTFEAKVMAGLEKPKPKPPPPPPPPKTNKEIAMDVAGVVAKTTGQAAVVVGKGTISLTATAAKAAFNAAAASMEKNKTQQKIEKKNEKESTSLLSKFASTVDNQKKKQERVEVEQVEQVEQVKQVEQVSSTLPVEPIEVEPIEIPKTIGEIDPLLELEVADALKSAEEALVIARKEKENPKSKLTTIEINMALEKARSAAAQARKNAEDLEMMLQERKEHLYKP